MVVYTAITGITKDRLQEVPDSCREPGVDFVCFSNCITQSPKPWIIKQPVWIHENDRRTARYHKINSHLLFPDSDYTIWHDGSHTLMVPPSVIMAAAGNHQIDHMPDMATFRHPQRDCVYEEYRACAQLKKDNIEIMRRQIEQYRSWGYPDHSGLVETAVLLRRTCLAVERFNIVWWRMLSEGSVRDQLSFNPALASTPGEVRPTLSFLPGCRDKSDFFSYLPHR
jgi:hypothetical protein